MLIQPILCKKPKQRSEESGPVTVTMIAAQYGNETADWWVGFEQKFEEAHKDIDLVVDVVSWNDIYTVVNTRIANGEAPDLLNIDVFADYQADGLLLPAWKFPPPGKSCALSAKPSRLMIPASTPGALT